jgi:tetratricopeptide (TPR) repeat protein
VTGLKQAREALGWSQTKTVAQLIAAARRRGVMLPEPGTLKSQLSRWENGRVGLSELYRGLFCEIYDCTEEQLGLAPLPRRDEQPASQLLTQFAKSRVAGPAAALAYAQQVDAIRVLDREMGAPAALAELRALCTAVQDLLSHAVLPSAREPVAGVLADAAALAGWQALDTGDIQQAWKMHETAKVAAREARDVPALAHAMGQQAYVLLDVGQAGDAVQLVSAARATGANHVPAVLDAWLLAAEAETFAALRYAGPAQRALDQAAKVLPGADQLEELPYIALNDAHLGRWRGNVLAKLGDVSATEDLYRALAAMDPTFTRARASLECDLAQALVARGDRSEARKHVVRARQLAQHAGSVRQRQRIDRLSFAA